MLVNQSKSSIIRLLGQGVSPYKGQISPAQFQIKKSKQNSTFVSSCLDLKIIDKSIVTIQQLFLLV